MKTVKKSWQEMTAQEKIEVQERKFERQLEQNRELKNSLLTKIKGLKANQLPIVALTGRFGKYNQLCCEGLSTSQQKAIEQFCTIAEKNGLQVLQPKNIPEVIG